MSTPDVSTPDVSVPDTTPPALPLVANERGFPIHPDDPGEVGYAPGTKRWGVHPEEATILTRLAVGRDVLEIGTGLGVGTRALAATALSVSTIDIDPWVHETIWPGLRHDCPNVFGYAHPAALDPLARYDLVFVDGLHTREHVAADLQLAVSRLSPHGMIVLHDANMVAVRQGVFDVLPKVRIWVLPVAAQLGLIFP